MSSTRERDALPKTFSRRTRLMFWSTEAAMSQCESSVFVSPIRAPALMIFEVYRGEDWRFSGSVVHESMVLINLLKEVVYYQQRFVHKEIQCRASRLAGGSEIVAELNPGW